MGIKSFIVIIIVAYFGYQLKELQFPWANKNVIVWDMQEYYMYLPAAFIYEDLSFSFADKLPQQEKDKYWYHTSPSGKKIGRMSIGMSILYLPFFTYGHIRATMTGAPLTGFSEPYQWAIFMSGFVYMLFGLLVLGIVLRRYFTDLSTALTLLCMGLGTNLYYYATIEAAMTHAPLFFLFACFLYFTDSWHSSYKWKHIIGLGIVTGLAALSRPTSLLILSVFFLYGVTDRQSFTLKIKLFKTHLDQLLLLLGVLVVMALPQLIYWKLQSGHWVYYSYEGQKFFFDRPRIFKGLLSFRKGWLIYSPVMAFALTGFIFRKKFEKQWASILFFTALNIYVVLSWWCWWYGGGFGMRAFIESYALLTFPMAAFWEQIKMKWRIWIPALLLTWVFIHVNRRQTEQYRLGLLHWDSMSYKFYKESFLKLNYDQKIREYLDAPDYEAAMKGERE